MAIRQPMCNWITCHKDTLQSYARGIAGGLLFGTPLIFTMEFWWLGFTMTPERLLITLAANFLILLILERYSGFREETTFLEEVQDAIVALGLGLVTSSALLWMINLLRPEMDVSEIVGKVILQAVGISIGISVSISMLGQQSDSDSSSQEERKEAAGFWGDQAISFAGAVFFGLNIAVTEEPIMMGLQMTELQSLSTLILSIILVFAITYALQFRGGMPHSEDRTWKGVFLNNSIATTATAQLCAAGLLVLVGSIDSNTGLLPACQMIVILGFATSLGAAAARLLI